MIVWLLRTFGIAAAGGGLFQLAHVPLPWMLGPLAAILAGNAILKGKLVWPRVFRDVGLTILGYMLGLSFTLEIAIHIMKQLPSMLIFTASSILFSMLMAYVFCRLTGIDIATGIIGSIPGGLSQMVVLGEEVKNTDVSLVAFMQTVRILCVVFIVPFLAIHGFQHDGSLTIATGAAPGLFGPLEFWSWHLPLVAAAVLLAAWTFVRFKLPIPYLIGPILASIAMTVSGYEAPHPPSFIIMLAQLMFGTYMGLIIRLDRLSKMKKLLPYMVLNSVLVIAFTFFLGYGLILWYPVTYVTGFLALAPGGVAEMGVTAASIHADVSVVAAYQLFRMLFILFTVPPFLLWGFRRLKA